MPVDGSCRTFGRRPQDGTPDHIRPKEKYVTTTMDDVRNGVDTRQLFGTLDLLKEQPMLGKFQFRERNRWIGGAHNRTTIRDFYAAGAEDTSRGEAFDVDAGEP